MNIKEETERLAKELEQEKALLAKNPETPFLETAIRAGEKQLMEMQDLLAASQAALSANL